MGKTPEKDFCCQLGRGGKVVDFGLVEDICMLSGIGPSECVQSVKA